MAAEDLADDDKPEQDKSDKASEAIAPAGTQVLFSEWRYFIFCQHASFDIPLMLQMSFIS